MQQFDRILQLVRGMLGMVLHHRQSLTAQEFLQRPDIVIREYGIRLKEVAETLRMSKQSVFRGLDKAEEGLKNVVLKID